METREIKRVGKGHRTKAPIWHPFQETKQWKKWSNFIKLHAAFIWLISEFVLVQGNIGWGRAREGGPYYYSLLGFFSEREFIKQWPGLKDFDIEEIGMREMKRRYLNLIPLSPECEKSKIGFKKILRILQKVSWTQTPYSNQPPSGKINRVERKEK